MNYSAIDLHSNNCVVVVTDEADRVIVEKRVANDLNAILPPWQILCQIDLVRLADHCTKINHSSP